MHFIHAPTAAWAEVPRLQVPIPNVQFSEPQPCGTDNQGRTVYCNKWLSEYISGAYKYMVGALGIMATIMMMIGGAIWLTAGGDAGKVTTAKSYITGGITGMVIGLSTYLILFQINPDLVKLPAIRIVKVEKRDLLAPSSDRLQNCNWSPGGCNVDQGFVSSPGKCSQETNSDNNTAAEVITGSSECCCSVKPQSGCSWANDCSSGQERASYDRCGTYWGGPNQCCCGTSQTCNDGKCNQIDSAIASVSNSSGYDAALVKSILVGGEGCSAANGSGSQESCGYSQVTRDTRAAYCGGISCTEMRNNPAADIQCGINVLKAYQKLEQCWNVNSPHKPAQCSDSQCMLASCYNAGPYYYVKHGRNICGTDNYCMRVQDYYNSCQK